jgi:hypothetical protein
VHGDDVGRRARDQPTHRAAQGRATHDQHALRRRQRPGAQQQVGHREGLVGGHGTGRRLGEHRPLPRGREPLRGVRLDRVAVAQDDHGAVGQVVDRPRDRAGGQHPGPRAAVAAAVERLDPGVVAVGHERLAQRQVQVHGPGSWVAAASALPVIDRQ